jgi:hypothetical protein
MSNSTLFQYVSTASDSWLCTECNKSIVTDPPSAVHMTFTPSGMRLTHFHQCLQTKAVNEAGWFLRHVLPAPRHQVNSVTVQDLVEHWKAVQNHHPILHQYVQWFRLQDIEIVAEAAWRTTAGDHFAPPSFVMKLQKEVAVKIPKHIFTQAQFRAFFSTLSILKISAHQLDAKKHFASGAVIQDFKDRFAQLKPDHVWHGSLLVDVIEESRFEGALVLYSHLKDSECDKYYRHFQQDENLTFHDLQPGFNSGFSESYVMAQQSILQATCDDLLKIESHMSWTKGDKAYTVKCHKSSMTSVLTVGAPDLTFYSNAQRVSNNERFFIWNHETQTAALYTAHHLTQPVFLPLIIPSEADLAHEGVQLTAIAASKHRL